MSEPKGYREFWPFYLGEHDKPLTRNLHFAGTSLVLVCFVLGLTHSSSWFWLMPIAGYSLAWMSHFFVEKNRPATFKYPLYSLLADFHMFALMATGQLSKERHRLGLGQEKAQEKSRP